jgi:glycine/D-amino acid oxidase-like deaminating enzyme
LIFAGVQVDYLIIGQGLCGTWLSYYLLREGATVLVIDEGIESSASNAASGIINPVTGKRLARQWMAEIIQPFAEGAYTAIGVALGTHLITPLPIHTFFTNAEEAALFERKASSTHEDLLSSGIVAESEYFNFHYGVGTISTALNVDVRGLLQGWRKQLGTHSILHEEGFDWSACELREGGVSYKGIEAKAVIDCTGAACATGPYFRRLPFALNKGEVIIASIPGLPMHAIYKYAHLSIVPWEDHRFWIGSTFDWDYTDELPTDAFRTKAEAILNQWLRLSFTFHEHFAAIRPATVTRDAFAGMHPLHPRVGILNGTGSKGCSLSPFLAHNLARHLVHGEAIIPQVDISRYTRALSR